MLKVIALVLPNPESFTTATVSENESSSEVNESPSITLYIGSSTSGKTTCCKEAQRKDNLILFVYKIKAFGFSDTGFYMGYLN